MDNNTDRPVEGRVDLRPDDAVVATDADGQIYWANLAYCRLCGFRKDEVYGRRPDELLQGKETDPATVNAIRSAIRNGNPLTVEVLKYHKGGQSYWVSLELSPTKTREGRLTGFIAKEHGLGTGP